MTDQPKTDQPNPAPLYSVVTVVRDDLAGLTRTHDSLRRQSYRNFEWIVVDGDSKDGGRDYLMAFSDQIAWWRSEPDDGIYDAMNTGLAACTGTYVLFLNAGDSLPSMDTLAKFSDALMNAGFPEFCYGDAWENGTNGKMHYKPARSHRRAWYGMFTHHQSMLYLRSILHDITFDTYFSIGADYAFTLKVLAKSDSIIHVPQPLCIFAGGGLSELQASIGRSDQACIRKEILHHGVIRQRIVALIQLAAFVTRKLSPSLFGLFRYNRVHPPLIQGMPYFQPRSCSELAVIRPSLIALALMSICQ
ncbi:MAG: glycosyltransferase family 2 protein [Rhodospirillaceae bacterium]